MDVTRTTLIFWLLVVLGSSGCATTGDYVIEEGPEGFNRASYNVTDVVDRNVLVPVAKGYQTVTPNLIEQGITNFFTNLQVPLSSLNGFLQGKPLAGAEDLTRFLVNSTLGVAGLIDIATHAGIRHHQEDLGQTFAVWGWRETRYLFIPGMGPTTWRDLPSTVLTSYVPRLIFGSDYPWGASALNLINTRAALLAASEARDSSALDPYAFTRDAYIQRRRYLIYDGDLPMDDLFDEFDDLEDDEDF